MAISIEQYRAIIGSFTPTNYHDKVKTKKRKILCCNLYFNILTMICGILAMTIFASGIGISEDRNTSSKCEISNSMPLRQ